MAHEKTQLVSFDVTGFDDKIEYKKFDMVKASRLGGNVALSFYQLDYLALTTVLTNERPEKSVSDIKLIPIIKAVTDIEGFFRLKTEINNLYDRLKENDEVLPLLIQLEKDNEPITEN